MPRLLVAGRLHPAGEARIAELPAGGMTVDYVEDLSDSGFLPFLPEADALILRTQRLPEAVIAGAPRLKVVSRHGVGYDAVDVAALSARGIGLTIVGDVNSVSVAEQALLFLLAGAKRALAADRAVRGPGDWDWRNRMEPREMTGRTLLILGFGRAGRRLAGLVSGFGMEVIAHDPYLSSAGWPEGPVRPVADLAEGLARADFISLHVPLTDGPLLGRAELARVKPGVVIANTARGGVICETALAEALADGRVAAVGLDVFATEPPGPDLPFATSDRALLSPHVAGLSAESAARMALAAIDNALAYLDGTIDPDLVVNRMDLPG